MAPYPGDSKAFILAVETRGVLLRSALQELGFRCCAEPDFQEGSILLSTSGKPAAALVYKCKEEQLF